MVKKKKTPVPETESVWMPRDNPFLSWQDKDSWWVRRIGGIPIVGRMARPGHLPIWFMAALMPALALLASFFGILSRSAAMNILLCRVSTGCPPKDASWIHVGYLYEANAAGFYLLAAGAWVWLYLRFLKTAKNVISGLAKDQILVTVDPSDNVMDCVARLRRGRWSRIVMCVAILISCYSAVGSEFNLSRDACAPHERLGDFWHLAFGYVQASAVPKYNGKTLEELRLEGRSVENIDALHVSVKEQEFKDWKIVKLEGSSPAESVGPRGPLEERLFGFFLLFAVGAETIFVPFAAWTVIQVAFVLWILLRALTAREYSLRWIFQPTKEARLLLKDYLDELYGSIRWLIYIGIAAEVASITANIGKGSDDLSLTSLPIRHPSGSAKTR